jgi:hypothetical protein
MVHHFLELLRGDDLKLSPEFGKSVNQKVIGDLVFGTLYLDIYKMALKNPVFPL